MLHVIQFLLIIIRKCISLILKCQILTVTIEISSEKCIHIKNNVICKSNEEAYWQIFFVKGYYRQKLHKWVIILNGQLSLGCQDIENNELITQTTLLDARFIKDSDLMLKINMKKM